MKKSLLNKVPIASANKELINKSKETKINKDIYRHALFFTAEEISIDNEAMLLLYLYSKANLTEDKTHAEYRVFLTKNDWITQEIPNFTKWKTASLGYLLMDWSYSKIGRTKCLIADNKSAKTIKDYLQTDEDPIEAIFKHQEKIMLDRLNNKHKATKERIDSEMLKVPEIPGDFSSWIDETALFSSRYIYYKYKPKQKTLEGYCTNCETDLVVEAPRHNTEGICPNCNSPIICKALGKSMNIYDTVSAALPQKIEGGFVIRFFRVNKDYRLDYKNPKTTYYELARDVYYSNRTNSYEWTVFKQSGKERWCDYNNKYDFSQVVVYEDSITESIKDTKYQYSALKELATNKPGFKFNVARYLSYYKDEKYLEYLVKLKLYNMAIDLINRFGSDWIDREGTNLIEILKVSKSSIPILQVNNSNLEELRLVQTIEKMQTTLPAEQIKYVYNNFGCATPLIGMIKYTTIGKAIKYIESNATEKIKSNVVYTDWLDYVRFCEELEYDLNNEFVLYPKNLKQEHDRLSIIIQAKHNKEKAEKLKLQKEKIKSMATELNNKYGLKYKNYIIIPPKNAAELTKEGQTLHHCVGTYIERIAEGKSVILFIRKKSNPDKPFGTLEIINNKINQCRGKYNIDLRDDLKDLFKRLENVKLNIEHKEAV